MGNLLRFIPNLCKFLLHYQGHIAMWYYGVDTVNKGVKSAPWISDTIAGVARYPTGSPIMIMHAMRNAGLVAPLIIIMAAYSILTGHYKVNPEISFLAAL